MLNLRQRLRRETASAHGRVDGGFSGLDLATADGLARFLTVQRAALAAIRCRRDDRAAAAEELRDEMLDAVEADLRHLGLRGSDALQPEEIGGAAVLYGLLGSRLGLRVLRRRWQESGDPVVAATGRLLGLRPRSEEWRAFCEEMVALPAAGGEAEALLRDARRLFGLYEAAQARSNVLPDLAAD